MTFQKALQIYDLDSLNGTTEAYLKKTKRKLVKANHPDSGKVSNISMDDVVEAYEILLTNLQGKCMSTQKEISHTVYTGFYKQKDKKILNYKEYKEAIDIKDRRIEDLCSEYLLFVSFRMHFILRRQGKEVLKRDKIYQFMYERNTSYTIEINVNFELGDELEVIFEDGEKILTGVLNKVNTMMFMEVSMNIIDKLKFTIFVTQE